MDLAFSVPEQQWVKALPHIQPVRFKQKLLQNIKKQNITKQTGFKNWYEAEDLTKMSKRLAQEKLRDLLKKKSFLLNTFRDGSGKKKYY